MTRHQFLPLSELGDPSMVPGKFLSFCFHGDWWNIVWHTLEESCPTHGTAYSRTPRRGGTAEGPCPGCGQAVIIDDFNPDALSLIDIYCTACRGENG